MASSMHGYSGKTLADKLGLKEGLKAAVIEPPPHYRELLRDVPIPGRLRPGLHDFIHVFAPETEALRLRLPMALEHLAPGGTIWVSWPKTTSAMFIDLTEDGVRAQALPLGLVDVKVCAVDQDWSGLKLVRRKS